MIVSEEINVWLHSNLVSSQFSSIHNINTSSENCWSYSFDENYFQINSKFIQTPYFHSLEILIKFLIRQFVLPKFPGTSGQGITTNFVFFSATIKTETSKFLDKHHYCKTATFSILSTPVPTWAVIKRV